MLMTEQGDKMTPKKNLILNIRHENPQWLPQLTEAIVQLYPPIIERPDAAGKDVFGVEWSLDDDCEGGTYPTHGGHTITDLEQWREQITIPDVDAFDWSVVAEQAKQINREENFVQGFIEMGVFERSYMLLSMDEALIAYLTDTDLMNEMLSEIADYKIKFIERFNEECDLDMMWYGDDWGTQNNLFLPPDLWRKTVKPHTQRIYDCMKRLGIMINQHSCGMIEPIFGDMVEMGADFWNPCQPCNDLGGLKKEYGDKITFVGGLDSQFVLNKPGVTAEEVRAEVRKCIDLMGDTGGYIVGPSHNVPYDPVMLAAMDDEIATYGRQFLAK